MQLVEILKTTALNQKTTIINVIMICISLLICILMAELFLNLYYYKNRDYASLSEASVYDNIGNNNNHIRQFSKKRFNSKSLYYTQSVFRSNGKTVLFQGDSWAELIDRNNLLAKILKSNENIRLFINGGTSSYSPSLIEQQFNDITDNTKEKFDLVVVYIDQTDFMDEACQYNKLRIEDSKGNLLAVRKDMGLLLDRYSLYNQRIFTMIEASETKILAFIYGLLDKNMRKTMLSPRLCKWNDISKFMRGESTDEDNYVFKRNLRSLLSTYSESGSRVILLTHKHRKHYTGEYKFDIYDIIKREISSFRNIELIDISSPDINKNNLDEVFPSFESDKASHPHAHYYKDKLVPVIAELVDKRL